MSGTATSYFSGLSGIQLPIPKYKFPQAHQHSSRLTYYSTFFNSIEINSSFYKIPQKATVARWAASVPDTFSFTFKLPRDITHTRDLDFNRRDIQEFMNAIGDAGMKRGCILVQFPPALSSANIPQLDVLLETIRTYDTNPGWNIAVEFRNKEWYRDEVFVILEKQDCGLVVHDKPACSTPSVDIASPFVYVRFHGPTGNYRGSYSEEYLHEYAEYVKGWLSDGITVYVYFNNTAGDAFANLHTFNQLI